MSQIVVKFIATVCSSCFVLSRISAFEGNNKCIRNRNRNKSQSQRYEFMQYADKMWIL